MSFAALAWASKYRAGSAAEKLVLFAYADRHNEDTGSAYPSLAWLCEFTSLNRKTIIAAITKLEAAGVLSDTGERSGTTKQIKVYRLEMETVPKTEQSQRRNSTEKGGKQSQKRDTEPVRTGSQKASPSSKRARDFEIPDWVPVEPWQAFVEMRRETGHKLTEKAKKLAIGKLDELRSAGNDPAAVLNQSTFRSWRGLFKVDGAESHKSAPVLSDQDRACAQNFAELQRRYQAGEISFDEMMASKSRPPPPANRDQPFSGKISDLVSRISGAA